MLLITKNAEEALYRELKFCWESFPTHRCLHLKFSQLAQEKEEWISDVLDSLRSFLDEESFQIYLCHDKDVFVLTRTMTYKRADDFLAHLAPKLQSAPLQELAALFEIGVDWWRLRTICEKKIENLNFLNAKKPAQKNEEAAPVSRDKVFSTIDRDLISSLAMRRVQRDIPEIMVVEDDPFSQKLVGNALKNKYSVSITGDGQGAIMGYVNKAPDVLFLDIGLPDIDGHEVLKKIFKIDPDAYVVMFSGNGDRNNIMKAIELGAKGFVGKPFTQEKLFQYIDKSPFMKAKQKKENLHGHSIH